MRTSERRQGVAAAAVMAVSAVGLAACSGGGGGAEEATCANEIKQPDAAQVTVWSWYPAFDKIVDNFNDTHTDLQVCWTNAGQGADEYNRFQTAIEAGTGAPDVIMLETEVLPTFTILESLVDLSEYRAADLEGDYTAGSWSDVSNGDAVWKGLIDDDLVAMEDAFTTDYNAALVGRHLRRLPRDRVGPRLPAGPVGG